MRFSRGKDEKGSPAWTRTLADSSGNIADSEKGAAECAVSPDLSTTKSGGGPADTAPELAEVIAAWPRLLAADRAAILALVRHPRKQGGQV